MTSSTTSFFPPINIENSFLSFSPMKIVSDPNQGADVQYELTNNQSVCMMHMKARCSLRLVINC